MSKDLKPDIKGYKEAFFEAIKVSILALGVIFFMLLLPTIGIYFSLIDAIIFGYLFGFLLLFFIGIFFLFKKDKRYEGICYLLIICFVGGLLFPTLKLIYKLRPYSFYLVTVRGNYIVEAVEKYHEDKGTYPLTLDEVIPEYTFVPEYVLRVPIGMRLLQYSSSKEGFCFKFNASMGVLNWDEFLYCSDQSYIDTLYHKNAITWINGWAYYHE